MVRGIRTENDQVEHLRKGYGFHYCCYTSGKEIQDKLEEFGLDMDHFREERTAEHYPEAYQRGFTWKENFFEKDNKQELSKRIDELTEDGSEVYVGFNCFDIAGLRMYGYAILTRPVREE